MEFKICASVVYLVAYGTTFADKIKIYLFQKNLLEGTSAHINKRPMGINIYVSRSFLKEMTRNPKALVKRWSGVTRWNKFCSSW